MPITIEHAALNLILALFCGALIGSERQVRQRMAGLRTNALVALGAASFVVFSQLFPQELSPTRVAAQVVSGIGFLGAGIIFRHGFTIHGLNTAATLWCSAAVGLMAGAGAPAFAALVTALIIFINLGLRPLVKWIKRKTRAGMPLVTETRLSLSCAPRVEAEVRALVLATLTRPEISIVGISKEPGTGDLVTLEVSLCLRDVDDSTLGADLAPLLVDARLAKIAWESGSEE